MQKNYEVIIVGAGPAGSSTAIHITNMDPTLAGRVLLLDRASFPRPKLCAGGITGGADYILTQLGVPADLPAVPVHKSKFILPFGSLTLNQDNHFRVVRREEFDQHLFRTAKDHGVTAKDGEAVEQFAVSQGGVIVKTSKEQYTTKVIIGADGANSTVRRSLAMLRAPRIMMAMETHAPLREVLIPDLTENMAIFDFSIVNKGVSGYCWVFPSEHSGTPMCSLGIGEAPFSEDKRVPLKAAFLEWLGSVTPDLKEPVLRAHPALRYEPWAQCSQYRVLLVGDAAGVDPLFGEGITSALALGMLAAESALEALRNEDFTFSDYQQRIRSSFIGSIMRRRRTVARRFYSGFMTGRRKWSAKDILDWVSPAYSGVASPTVLWEPSYPQPIREV